MFRSILDTIKEKFTPLNLADLLATVKNETKLESPGDSPCEEALRVLIDSCNAEAGLNLFGQIAAREHLSGLLETRLRLIDCWRQTPAIQTQTVLPALFITGACTPCRFEDSREAVIADERGADSSPNN